MKFINRLIYFNVKIDYKFWKYKIVAILKNKIKLPLIYRLTYYNVKILNWL
jgi:hypothetical protein